MIDPNAPMPWIGLYAAIVSLTWTIVLLADTVHSVRHRKLWFPCTYSALNATSLAVLSVAVKLSMDLTTPMTVSTSKRHLEHKYNELHKRISAEELQGDEIMDFDKLKLCVKKYWVMTETGAKHQPRYLLELIENSTSFDSVLKLESDQLSPVICTEPLNCWSLSVATLTSILIALPNVQNEERNKLLRSVIEGFKYVRHIEKSLDVAKKLVSSTSAADFAWVTVELKHKWLYMDLQKIARVSKSCKETLENLANKSEEILKEFTSRMNGNAMESPINLPENIIIANSMYKITKTLLLVYEESYHSASDTQVFERLSVILADILAACLTNLPHFILKKCHNSVIEEREKSIQEATRLLGETQDILKALQKREIPNLSPEQSIYIDKWRTLLKHTNHGITDSTPISESIITASSGEVHLDIQELCATEGVLETDEGNAKSHVRGKVEESGDEKENNQA